MLLNMNHVGADTYTVALYAYKDQGAVVVYTIGVFQQSGDMNNYPVVITNSVAWTKRPY
jgi:hypothetical protein